MSSAKSHHLSAQRRLTDLQEYLHDGDHRTPNCIQRSCNGPSRILITGSAIIRSGERNTAYPDIGDLHIATNAVSPSPLASDKLTSLHEDGNCQCNANYPGFRATHSGSVKQRSYRYNVQLAANSMSERALH
jgi:hypothetical protein